MVLADMVDRVLGVKVPRVYVDTGLEFPEIREFVQTFDNVVMLKPDIPFRDVILSCGYPLAVSYTHLDVYKRQVYGCPGL